MKKTTRIISLIAGIAGLAVAGLMILKAALTWASFQSVNNKLASLGTSFNEQGVNADLIYTALTLTFVVAGVAVVGSILSIRGMKIGPILFLACSAVAMVGFFITVVDEAFTYGSIWFYANVNLIETFLGIGEPIILAGFGVPALVLMIADKE